MLREMVQELVNELVLCPHETLIVEEDALMKILHDVVHLCMY